MMRLPPRESILRNSRQKNAGFPNPDLFFSHEVCLSVGVTQKVSGTLDFPANVDEAWALPGLVSTTVDRGSEMVYRE